MSTKPTPEQILHAAIVAHETNRAFCRTLGDFSQPDWGVAPEWQRTSALNGVQAIADNPATTPEQSHEGWSREKIENGWTYGPVKDADAKTHPCLVPYSELPEAQQRKDALFGAVVRVMLGLPVFGASEIPEGVVILEKEAADALQERLAQLEKENGLLIEEANILTAERDSLLSELKPVAVPTSSEGAEA